jgi:hypothetical protein
MTVHLISVGLSVLRKLREPYRELPDGNEDLARAIDRCDPRPGELPGSGITRDEASDWLAKTLADGGCAASFLDVAKGVRLATWPRTMSAELTTFAKGQQSQKFALAHGDIAVLICSDTPDGLLAGLWNAIAIAGGDLSRVRYVPGLSHGPGSSPRGLGDIRDRVVLVRVTGMDAGTAGFRGAMGGLGLLAWHLFASGSLKQPAEEFHFHLSGGFKATVPYLIGMAEAVHSIDATCFAGMGVANLMPKTGPYPVRAYVEHDTAGPQASLIQLPLRRLPAGTIRQELSRYTKSESGEWTRGTVPSPALLEGYAYDIDGGRCKLTAFGAGLRALFVSPAEGFGG